MAIFRDADSRRHARQAVKCALGILAPDAGAERDAPWAARAARRSHRREFRPRHGGRHEDRGAPTARGGPTPRRGRSRSWRPDSPRSREETRSWWARHPRAPGRRVLVRALGERPLRNVEVPVEVFRLTVAAARARGRHGLSGRRRASRPRRIRARQAGRPQPRPIDQNSAPKWSHGRRHSSVRSRVRREEPVDRVEDRLGRGAEVRHPVSDAPGDQQPVAAPRAQDEALERWVRSEASRAGDRRARRAASSRAAR